MQRKGKFIILEVSWKGSDPFLVSWHVDQVKYVEQRGPDGYCIFVKGEKMGYCGRGSFSTLMNLLGKA